MKLCVIRSVLVLIRLFRSILIGLFETEFKTEAVH